MLVFLVSLLLSALNSAAGAERQFLTQSLPNANRGIVEANPNAAQGYNFHQFQPAGPNVRSITGGAAKPLTYYKDGKIVQESPLINPAAYGDVYKQSLSVHPSATQSNEQLLPYADGLFTMSAGYKVANEDFPKPLKQAANLQVPVYKTSYPLPKASGVQVYAPTFHDKKSLPILQLQKSQEVAPYLSSFQSQPVVVNPVDHQFNFAGRTAKVNQLAAPFLSPLSSFQGQVVPISTVANNPQFPQYKGATVEVYPTVAGFSSVAYQPLQTQPQLHFGHGNVQHVQPVGNLPRPKPIEEIRSDVEIINKKKPPPPPKKDEDDDDDDDDDNDDEKNEEEEEEEEDEGDSRPEKYHRENSEDDDRYEAKYFKAPTSEGNFKPSTSFPFKQYDEKFGKYSSRNRNEDADEKPFSKYREYSFSSDDSDDDHVPSGKYQSEDTSSKPYHSRHENDDDDKDDRRGYERQRTEESSDDKPKYFDKDFDEEFEASYRRELPRQRYSHAKEVPEVEHRSRSSKRNKDTYGREDPSGEGSQSVLKYYKKSQDFKDAEGFSSDIVASIAPETVYEGTFGYRIPRKNVGF